MIPAEGNQGTKRQLKDRWKSIWNDTSNATELRSIILDGTLFLTKLGDRPDKYLLCEKTVVECGTISEHYGKSVEVLFVRNMRSVSFFLLFLEH